jgi:hypothetical protein
MFPDLDISPAVPATMVRAITEQVNALRSKGATNILIQIPAEDFARTMDAMLKSVFYPFRPTLAGASCAPWEKDHVGMMARMSPEHHHPLLVDLNGREIAEVE